MMKQLAFKVQVVTPLFLSGADQQLAELRPPSIRGALRFWFRAMMGGIVNGDVEEVRHLESQVFGNTVQASQLAIRVDAPVPQPKPWNFRLEPDRGIVYLGYGLSGSRTSPRRVYISPDSPGYEFDLRLSCREEATARVVIGAWWLLTEFGGLGARSRRGFGSLQVSDCSGLPSDLQGLFTPPTDSVKEWLQSNLPQVRQLFSDFAGVTIQDAVNPTFPIISKGHWGCRVLEKAFGTSWKDAMNWIGQEFRRFREDRTRGQHTRTSASGTFSYYISKDYDDAKKLLAGQRPTTLRLPIFGLPLQFQFQSVGKTVRVLGASHERRSSPLHIRIQRKALHYRVYLIHFKSAFLADQEQLRVEEVNNESNHILLAIPPWLALDRFVSLLRGEEVVLS